MEISRVGSPHVTAMKWPPRTLVNGSTTSTDLKCGRRSLAAGILLGYSQPGFACYREAIRSTGTGNRYCRDGIELTLP